MKLTHSVLRHPSFSLPLSPFSHCTARSNDVPKIGTAVAHFQIAILSLRADFSAVSMPTLTFPPARLIRTFLFTLAVAVTASAQSVLPGTSIPLDNLAAFRSPTANWEIAGAIGGDPRTQKILPPIAGSGILVNNLTPAAHGHLVTTAEYGDAEVDLDFLMTPGSNSGVYLMGRYEVQLFDSWGVKSPAYSDCGGIYQRWDDARGANKQGYEGHAPLANASRAPGLWQHLHIEFQAPRFDASGKKTANAKFLKVVLNDFVVQENVEVTGPTRSPAFDNEAARGPLLIQGDHGPLAIRALAIKQFDPATPPVQVADLTYKLFALDPESKGKYDATTPKSQGTPSAFSSDAVEKNGKFAIIFSGTFVLPRDGAYAFSTGGYESVNLVVDEQPAIQPYDGGGQSVPLNLSAGRHAFRLEYIHSSSWGRAHLALSVEGPGLARQLLTALPEAGKDKPRRDEKPHTLVIEPTDNRVRMQRSFVPFDPKKRLYAINVGTPAGVHYAYDSETAAILRVWRGDFLDTFEMWDGRGENQLGKPAGPSLTLSAKPVLALLERYTNDWPTETDAMWSSQGYRLESDGQPTFLFKLSSLSATDRIAPAKDGAGLTRTLVVTGETVSWGAWVLLAEADQITPMPGGKSYIIGDRSYYLDLPADSTVQPILRIRNGRQQLVVPINATTLGKTLVYSLVW